MSADLKTAPVLLYDGECGVCDKSVQMILKHDRRKVMRFAALQSNYGREVVARHSSLSNVDSLILVEPADERRGEQIFIRSTAVLRIVAYLGGLWKLLLIGYLIPRPIRDFMYDVVARNRYRILGAPDACMLPSPEVRARFLD
jgi:predicted DCC family thiol-disulfide oxidoreductase YuxK